MLLRRHEFGNYPITVRHEYGLAVRSKADILAQLVLEDFYPYRPHGGNVASGSYLCQGLRLSVVRGPVSSGIGTKLCLGRQNEPYGSAPQQLFRDPLHVAGLDLALVGLHDVADEAPDLLGVGDAEGGEALLDERPCRRFVHALR